MEGIVHFLLLCWNRRKLYIISLSINQIIKVTISMLALFLPKMVLDAVFVYKNFKDASIYIIFFLLSSLILNLTNQFFTYISSNERMKVFNSFQLDLAECMMSSQLEKLESRDFLDLKSKAELYLYGGGKGFASVLEESFDVITMCVSLALYGWIISQLNYIVLFVLIIVISTNIGLNYIYQIKYAKINLEKATQERKNAYYMNLFQDFSYGKEIKTYDLREWLLGKFSVQLKNMIVFYRQLNRNTMLYSMLSMILVCIQQFISYGYLLFRVMNKFLTVGSFSLFLNTITLFSSTVKSLVGQFISIKQYTVYYESYKKYYKIENVFSSGNEEIGVHVLKDNKIRIEFKNVSFRYPFNTHFSLKKINLTINDGDKIVIVGKNGAGKSTFIKLLLRIYKPTEGVITLNGVDINSIHYEDYLKLFATVFQDYKLFSQSIRENIIFDRDMNDDKVNDLLKKLGLNEKISKLNDGINTEIYKIFDKNGYIPSEGEAQKIAFARAISKGSPILILDEPSSALDPKSEFEIYELCEKIIKNKVCLFISHRLAISSLSNRILVFNDGGIVEEGSHSSLMDKKGIYYSMYKMQSKYYSK